MLFSLRVSHLRINYAFYNVLFYQCVWLCIHPLNSCDPSFSLCLSHSMSLSPKAIMSGFVFIMTSSAFSNMWHLKYSTEKCCIFTSERPYLCFYVNVLSVHLKAKELYVNVNTNDCKCWGQSEPHLFFPGLFTVRLWFVIDTLPFKSLTLGYKKKEYFYNVTIHLCYRRFVINAVVLKQFY